MSSSIHNLLLKVAALAMILIQIASIEAAPKSTRGYQRGITVVVQSADKFCLMLPPKPGQTIGDTEAESLSRCTSGVDAGSLGAQTLPNGFIKSAHFKSANDGSWVQVTGQMRRTKYHLSKDDEGGQYDGAAKGIRPGSACYGFGSYLSYIEPNTNTYCMRCCKDNGEAGNSPCNWHHDNDGCESRIPGDYS